MTCEKCGTDHDGYPEGSLGAQVRCIRAQAEALGATALVDQVDAFRAHYMKRLEEGIERFLNDTDDPSVTEPEGRD